MRGVLQPFRPLLLSWTGRRELVSLTGAESGGGSAPPAGPALLSGFYINELMMRLLHRNDPHTDLFETYRATLWNLRRHEGQEPVLRIFEKRLLAAIGYGLMLDREAESGQSIRAEAVYWYRRDRGPVRSAGDRPRGVRIHGKTLLGLKQEELKGAESLREAKHLMRYVLKGYLGEKPLATRELLRPMRR